MQTQHPGPLRGREGAGPRAHPQGAEHRRHALRHRRGAPDPGGRGRRRGRGDAPGALPGGAGREPAGAGDAGVHGARPPAGLELPRRRRRVHPAGRRRRHDDVRRRQRGAPRDDARRLAGRHAAARRARRRRPVLVPHRVRPGLRAARRVRALLQRRVRDVRQARPGVVRDAGARAVAQGGPRHRVRRAGAGARADADVVPHHADVAADDRARLHPVVARAARLRPAGGRHADAAAGRHVTGQPARDAARRQLRDHRHAVSRPVGGAGHAGPLLAGGRHHGPAHGALRGRRRRARRAVRRRHRDGPLLRPAGRVLGPLHADLRAGPADRLGEGQQRDARRRSPTPTCSSAPACSAAPRSSASSRSSWTSR